MKRSILITLVAVLATMTFTQCLSADTAQINVVMDIESIATIELNGTVIKLFPVPGSMDYEGVTSPLPSITCNVPVTVDATTVGVAPLVSTDWQTALQGTAYNGTPDSTSINVDPLASPFLFGVSVLAGNVDMTVRGNANDVTVATTTITVAP